MSNIPKARDLLIQLREHELEYPPTYRAKVLLEVLNLLDRKKPAFVSPRKIRALSDEQKQEARRMRAAGQPMNEIARALGTNLGRISEAVGRIC